MKQENIKLLKMKQEKLAKLKDNLEIKRVEFEEANTELFEEIKLVSESCDETKAEVSEEAIEEFKSTGEKKLLGGIGIRVLSKISYSEQDAINWSETNMPIAVKKAIDKKQFERFAKDNDLVFVNKEEKISVTFPKEIII